MSSTLLRLGLWITLAVVALYVLHETYAGTHLEAYFSESLLQKSLIVGFVMIAAGMVARVLEKGASKVIPKNRCKICKTSIPSGAIYCRQHLRNVLDREDQRTHAGNTRI
jgi:predicted nucleic acid-binding Zn ribbon protein